MNLNEKTSIICESIQELVTTLCESERTTYDHIIRSLKVPASAFQTYHSWSKDCYTRNCIFENENFELILLCWEPGQKTAIHDHGGEECWVRVIDGTFKETVYKTSKTGTLDVVKSVISKANDITYMIDFMGFHSLENMSKKRSLSLHLYAKPIRNCNVFDEKEKQFVNKDLIYHTLPCHKVDA